MDTQLADPMLGVLVDGRYRVRGRVARGGVATVYTAVDERLERTVAFKIIAPAQAVDPQFVGRFTYEAKAIARLTHPHVVAVYDQGVHDDRPYLVMEYVRGQTLREVLRQRRRLEPAEALAVAEQVLAALAAAHRAGMVHRDVKPENILVADGPRTGPGRLVDAVVKVADFGLARAVEASADDPEQLMATVAYVAPELVTDGTADPRADVYSAGVVLFEMLTGRVPYSGDRPVDVAWQHVDRDVGPPSRLAPAVPPELDALVLRATRRDRDRRPADAAAMLAEAAALREALGAAPEPGGPTVQVPTLRPARRARPMPRPGAGGALDRTRDAVLAAAAAAGAAVRRGSARFGPVPVAAAGLALALLVGLGVWWLAAGRYTPAPELLNLTKSEAQERARGAGLTLRFTEPRYDDLVRPDLVLSQQPPPGGEVTRGGTLTLTLSLGPENSKIPDVIGMTYEMASQELAAVRLRITRGRDQYHTTLPPGMVSAVEPQVGAVVRPSTNVTVTVSKGRPPISVPNVVGRPVDEVRRQLEQLGLVVTVQPVAGEQPRGQVLRQSLEPGTGVERQAAVTLSVSEGPARMAMPRVVDMACPEAAAALTRMGLRPRVEYNPRGIVKLQEPPEGTTVEPGREVKLGCL